MASARMTDGSAMMRRNWMRVGQDASKFAQRYYVNFKSASRRITRLMVVWRTCHVAPYHLTVLIPVRTTGFDVSLAQPEIEWIRKCQR